MSDTNDTAQPGEGEPEPSPSHGGARALRGRHRLLHGEGRARRAPRSAGASGKKTFDHNELSRYAVAHPVRASLPALAAAALAVMAIVGVISAGALSRAFAHHHVGWLLIAAVAELLSVVGYAVAYRTIVQLLAGLQVSAAVAARMVLTGFGMFAVCGGFSLDRLGLSLMGVPRRTADRSVRSLAVLEFAALSVAAFVGAIWLLATGSGVSGSMLWPWAIGVPAGATVALWRIRRGQPFPGRALERRIAAIEYAFAQLLHAPSAWLGIAAYFTADIASLGAALHAVNVSVAWLPLLIAYASGFTMTRRTLPFAGAVVVELLLTFSLYWVGVPLAGALAGVVVYRGFNLILIAGLATAARHRLPTPTQLDVANRGEAPRGKSFSLRIYRRPCARGSSQRRSVLKVTGDPRRRFAHINLPFEPRRTLLSRCCQFISRDALSSPSDWNGASFSPTHQSVESGPSRFGLTRGRLRCTARRWARLRHSRLILCWRAGWRGQLTLYLAAYGLYAFARGIGGGNLATATRNAHWVVRQERSVHVNVEGAVQRALDVGMPIWILNHLYLGAQLVVLPGALVFVYVRSPMIYQKLRNTILATWVLAIPIYVVFPVAPPRLAGVGIVDTISNGSHTGLALNSGFSTLFYNPLAAVPSLHAGFAFAVGIAVASVVRRRWTKCLALLWGPAVCLAVIATGNHFVFDVVAGLVITLLGFSSNWLPHLTRGSAKRYPGWALRSIPGHDGPRRAV